MFLKLALVFFACFVGNIVLATFSGASMLGDLGELIVLACAALSFVVAILHAEKHRDA